MKLTLGVGEVCWAAKGGIMSYADGVEWELRIPGGVGGAARRVLAGEGVGLAYLQAPAGSAEAALASNQPGKIFSWDLADGPVLTTRGSFLAAWGEVDITVTVARPAPARPCSAAPACSCNEFQVKAPCSCTAPAISTIVALRPASR